MSDITSKPIDEIAWADVQSLIETHAEEGLYLEFKSGQLCLPPNSKNAARDAACKAAVAFANAYGGTFILGIDEVKGVASGTDHNIQGLAAFLESFDRAVRSVIDPPIPGLQLRGIECGEGSGVILLRVPASLASPHGFKSPPECFVRVGKNSRPMTMRDLQSLFWDARTRRERVAEIRAGASAELAMLRQFFGNGELRDKDGQVIAPSESRLFFRATAIAQDRIALRNMPLDKWQNALRPSAWKLGFRDDPAFGDGSFLNQLGRIAHGLASENASERWAIRDDATVSLIGSRSGSHSDGYQMRHSSSWYTATIAQLLVMVDRVRRSADAGDAVFEVDCEIIAANGVQTIARTEYGLSRTVQPLMAAAKIGPFLLERRETIGETFAAIEREIWGFFGLQPSPAAAVNWDAAWNDG